MTDSSTDARACNDFAPDADRADGASANDPAPVPYIAGEFTRVFVPTGTNYLNDHTLVQGPDGWHLYGITHGSSAAPQEEREFVHASAPALLGPWTQRQPVLSARADLDEQVLWAPHVIQASAGAWTMVYWAGAAPATPQYGLRFADSSELYTWTRREAAPVAAARPPGGRDPFLLQHEGRWLLYSVWQSEICGGLAHGQIVVTNNDDLANPRGWSTPEVVLEDPRLDVPWGNVESPFVVPYAGQFYLFVTRTGRDSRSDYVRTLVFRSPDPRNFAWSPITTLWSHAAEVVRVGAEYFITAAGWTSEVGEIHRGLSIARLKWTEGG